MRHGSRKRPRSDSNRRRVAPADLQSAPFVHSGTRPRDEEETLWPRAAAFQRGERWGAHAGRMPAQRAGAALGAPAGVRAMAHLAWAAKMAAACGVVLLAWAPAQGAGGERLPSLLLA